MKENLEFICSSSIFLGKSTQNMAEYTGLIMGLLLCSMNDIKRVSIRSQSDLMIQ